MIVAQLKVLAEEEEYLMPVPHEGDAPGESRRHSNLDQLIGSPRL